MQTRYLREYDTVRVRCLKLPNRPYDGTESVKRAPEIGDIAAIVHEYLAGDPAAPVAVEMVDQDGMTVWLADFHRDELEFVERPNWAAED